MSVQMDPHAQRLIGHLEKNGVEGRRVIFAAALNGRRMGMRQPEQNRVFGPRRGVAQTVLQELFPALNYFDVLGLLQAERKVWQVPSGQPVFDVRLDGVGFNGLCQAVPAEQ